MPDDKDIERRKVAKRAAQAVRKTAAETRSDVRKVADATSDAILKRAQEVRDGQHALEENQRLEEEARKERQEEQDRQVKTRQTSLMKVLIIVVILDTVLTLGNGIVGAFLWKVIHEVHSTQTLLSDCTTPSTPGHVHVCYDQGIKTTGAAIQQLSINEKAVTIAADVCLIESRTTTFSIPTFDKCVTDLSNVIVKNEAPSTPLPLPPGVTTTTLPKR